MRSNPLRESRPSNVSRLAIWPKMPLANTNRCLLAQLTPLAHTPPPTQLPPLHPDDAYWPKAVYSGQSPGCLRGHQQLPIRGPGVCVPASPCAFVARVCVRAGAATQCVPTSSPPPSNPFFSRQVSTPRVVTDVKAAHARSEAYQHRSTLRARVVRATRCLAVVWRVLTAVRVLRDRFADLEMEKRRGSHPSRLLAPTEAGIQNAIKTIANPPRSPKFVQLRFKRASM